MEELFRLNSKATKFGFEIESTLDFASALNTLGSYLRTERETKSSKGKVKPMGDGKCLIIVDKAPRTKGLNSASQSVLTIIGIVLGEINMSKSYPKNLQFRETKIKLSPTHIPFTLIDIGQDWDLHAVDLQGNVKPWSPSFDNKEIFAPSDIPSTCTQDSTDLKVIIEDNRKQAALVKEQAEKILLLEEEKHYQTAQMKEQADKINNLELEKDAQAAKLSLLDKEKENQAEAINELQTKNRELDVKVLVLDEEKDCQTAQINEQDDKIRNLELEKNAQSVRLSILDQEKEIQAEAIIELQNKNRSLELNIQKLINEVQKLQKRIGPKKKAYVAKKGDKKRTFKDLKKKPFIAGSISETKNPKEKGAQESTNELKQKIRF